MSALHGSFVLIVALQGLALVAGLTTLSSSQERVERTVAVEVAGDARLGAYANKTFAPRSRSAMEFPNTEAGRVLSDLWQFAHANNGIKHNGMLVPQEAFNKGQQFCQISPLACSLLYKAASQPNTKRVLEVGALFGCSTSCIASGIADSKSGATFTSADLFLESVQEFESYFKGLCGSKEEPKTCEPHAVTKWALENGGFRKYYDQHLNTLNLAQYVTPTKGDFMKAVKPADYDVIYLDVTHTPMEIHRNVPFVVEHFARDKTVIVFDDIHNQASGGNTNSLADLQQAVSCHEGAFVDNMYVCIVKKA